MSSFPTYALLLQKRCSFLLQKAAAYGRFFDNKYVTKDHTVDGLVGEGQTRKLEPGGTAAGYISSDNRMNISYRHRHP